MRTEDGYIICKCLNGDSASFGFLVDKYKAGVYGFAYARLRNFHDAEDVSQEVFLKAYRNLRTLRRWDSFASWLYRIASNLCKNRIRDRSRRPDVDFIEDHDIGTLETPSEDSYRRELVCESVREALDSLPEMYRQVLFLHYLGGMTSAEIARFVGTSPTAVRMRLSKARSLLKEEILAMMDTDFGKQKLQATFTFRIMEAVKRMRIHPVPRATGVPWGLSLAAGLIVAIIGLNPHISIFDHIAIPAGSSLSVGARAAEVGEIPVTVLRIPQVPPLADEQGNATGGKARPSESQKKPLNSRSATQDDSKSPGSGTVKGKATRVTDVAHTKPRNLSGVTVAVRNDRLLADEGGERTVTTDWKGEYQVDNIPPGTYVITASKPGYKDIEQAVTVSRGAESFIDLRMPAQANSITREYVSDQVWQGNLDVDGKGVPTTFRGVPIIFRVTKHPKEPRFAVVSAVIMDRLDQDVEAMPVSPFVIHEGEMHVHVGPIDFFFHGKIDEDGMRTEGMAQLQMRLQPFLLRRTDIKPKLIRPQEPTKPSYMHEEVIYQNEEAGIEIAGTLTFPDSNGPFPAVILVSDFWPHDRDEYLDGPEHRPFLVLADYLTRHGMAVLRTDDRGKGGTTGDLIQSTIGDLAGDVLAGIRYLKSRKEIDAGRIGIMSRGLGSATALAAAGRSADIAFVILMGGTGMTGEEFNLSWIDQIGKADGMNEKRAAFDKELYRGIFAVLKEEEDDEKAMQKIRDVIVDITLGHGKAELSEERIKATRASSGLEHSNKLNPYFRSFLTFDPRIALMGLECPVLAISTEDDFAIKNLDSIEDALKAGGNKNYRVVEFPGLNYLFQTTQPDVPINKIEETISPLVLESIGDWLTKEVIQR